MAASPAPTPDQAARAPGAIGFIAREWHLLAQAAVALLAVISPILLEPPAVAGNPRWTALARYALGVLVALWLLPTSRWRKRRHARMWWIIAAVGLILSIAAAISYANARDRTTMPYLGNDIVIGDSLTADAHRYRDSVSTVTGRQMSNQELLGDYGSNLFAVWPETDIRAREFRLVCLYLVAVGLMASEIILAVQVAYTSTRRRA